MGIAWDPIKSDKLKRERGVAFEDILAARFVAIEQSPTRAHQSLLFFELNGYIWVIPYVSHGDGIFLKTLYPSRAYTKKWRRGELG